MQFIKRPTRLRLEALEQRTTPATIVYTGSLLTVTMQKAFLRVEETSVGSYQVKEGTSFATLANVGTYKTSGITINGSNAADTITIVFFNSSAGGMTGNLTVKSNNGNDSIGIIGGLGANNPVLRGSLITDLGYGNDSLGIGDNTNLTVRGTASLNGNLGSDSVFIGSDTSGNATLSNLNVTDFDFVNLADFAATAKATVTGIMTVTPGTGGLPMSVDIGYDLASTSDGGIATVNRLSVTGTALGDSVVVGKQSTIVGNGLPGDALFFNSGNGADLLRLRGNVGSLVANTGVTWDAGDGVDTIDIIDGVTIGSDLDLHMVATVNDPGNVFKLGTTPGGALGAVGGNLLISMVTDDGYGNNANEVIAFHGQVYGGLVVELGDADNTFSFSGILAGPISISNFSSDTSGFGGFGSGSGNNTLTINFTSGLQATVGFVQDTYSSAPLGDGIKLGTGADTLTFMGTITSVVGALDGSSFDGGLGMTNTLYLNGAITSGNPPINFIIVP